MGVIWQDNRTDPAYSVQRPIGNARDFMAGRSRRLAPTMVNYLLRAFEWHGASRSARSRYRASDTSRQYEMFGSRDIPFHGDYNWISLANTDRTDSLFGYMSWTDNRDVVPGTDPREIEEQNGFDDGFDVLQCRVDLGPRHRERGRGRTPRPPRRALYGDNCGNGGGLDQNIYGDFDHFPVAKQIPALFGLLHLEDHSVRGTRKGSRLKVMIGIGAGYEGNKFQILPPLPNLFDKALERLARAPFQCLPAWKLAGFPFRPPQPGPRRPSRPGAKRPPPGLR